MTAVTRESNQGDGAGLESRLGAKVEIEGLCKRYGDAYAVEHVSMDIAPGEFVTILGPSGSGKTTTLMAVAGFIDDYSGRIRIGDRAIDHLPPHRRDIGVVFQDLALFPHMTVSENIIFPLRMRGLSGTATADKLSAVLDLVRLSGLESRFPSQLSGGQQQRVALARAIVFSPPVLLLDEPFGALDRKLREDLQVEVKSLHRRLGITIILVTHDQTEAMAISDRIAVMNKGRIEQFSAPRELYFSPANQFVADFVGDSVFLHGKVTSIADGICMLLTSERVEFQARSLGRVPLGATATVMIRPERVLLGDAAAQSGNAVSGVVADVTFIGDRTKLQIALSAKDLVTAVVHSQPGEWNVGAGERISIGWKPQDALVFASK